MCQVFILALRQHPFAFSEALIVVGDHKPSEMYGLLDGEENHSKNTRQTARMSRSAGVGDSTSAYKRMMSRGSTYIAISKMDNWDFPDDYTDLELCAPMQEAEFSIPVKGTLGPYVN